MTRTEMLAALDRSRRLLWLAHHLNESSFAAMLVGVPLTLAAFVGLSPWPGIICWACSWGAFTLNSRLLAQATAINDAVARARSETTPER